MTKNKKLPPRTVPEKHNKYMGLAMWMAGFSKDPSTQVGAFILSEDNYPLSWGYNGPPRIANDDELDWSRPTKYDFMVHAEQNAIDNCLGRLEDATLYVTAKPCKACMLRIANVKIKEVIYFPFESKDSESTLSKKTENTEDMTDTIAKLFKVDLKEFDGNLSWMRDRIAVMTNLGIFKTDR